jgi:hypothetical protein
MPRLDPDDFVDFDGSIDYANFTIIPGDEVDHASLVFRRDGVTFLGGQTGECWAIDLYYPGRYNGDSIPISGRHARHILEKVTSAPTIEAEGWVGRRGTHFE